MRLVERDFRLFRWVNSHGYVTSFQIIRYLDVAKTTGYRRIKKLVDHGFLTRENILYGMGAVHRISKEAKDVSGDEIALLSKISLGGFTHNLKLVDVSLDLLEEHENSTFKTEREIRFLSGIGLSDHGHIPDGELVLSNGKRIAIELEMSVKASSRLDKIMKFYSKNLDYDEVHYFATDQIISNALHKARVRYSLEHLNITIIKGDNYG